LAYRYSNIDRKNLKWFERDTTKSTLLQIQLRKGRFRGLAGANISFKYPITAIAGRNGTGKTTALALACCAYHNVRSGHNPHGRKFPYYTFSEFFIQTAEEISPQGIEVWYEYIHDNWSESSRLPDGVGRGWQKRFKKKGGRWNDYATRVDRNVIFYGIERIVPHAEKSVYKSYRRRFREVENEGWEENVKEMVSRVLNRPYDKLWFKKYSKYSLPMVKVNNSKQSGFNLGAGENTLINIFSGILSCDDSLMVVIDEIELGLHEEAQIRLIRELKQLCADRHLQIVCTTHSRAILSNLPPEARIFLDGRGGVTTVCPGISADYAAGRLSGSSYTEVEVLVEDEVAKSIVLMSLGQDERYRSTVIPIGSAAAVIRQLAAHRKNPSGKEVIAILDGDMAENRDQFIQLFRNTLETTADESADDDWVAVRLTFLPGDVWPERWVVQTLVNNDITALENELGVPACELHDIFKEAQLAEKHSEYRHISERLGIEEGYLQDRLSFIAIAIANVEKENIARAVREALDRASA